ncbi:sugar nucleotide-binding protein [Achromobacter xylosoxidans]
MGSFGIRHLPPDRNGQYRLGRRSPVQQNLRPRCDQFFWQGWPGRYRELQRALLSFGELIALNRADCDLQDQEAIGNILSRHSPSLIVNAAAYTNVDEAEQHENAAYVVNAHAVGAMARYARRTGSLLIHYSTDYVFDGRSATPYSEQDLTTPINAYGTVRNCLGNRRFLTRDAMR